MATRTRLRDGSQVSGDVVQTPFGILLSGIVAATGVGTGFVGGIVGRKLGAGVDHLGVTANGANRTLTSAAGWAAVQRDSGLNGTPRAIEVEFDSSNTVTCAANASGSGRIDTIALRVDMTTAPDATGSNIATIVIVQGGASNALGNAPADSALYLPLANVAVANGAGSLSQGNVTDLRSRLFAFDTDTTWTAATLVNSWVNGGAPDANAQFRKVGSMVVMEGFITTGTAGTTAFTLPAGSRPANRIVLPVVTGANVSAVLFVTAAGLVQPQAGGANGSQINCSFFAEQ